MLDIQITEVISEVEDDCELCVTINGKEAWESVLRSSRPLYVVDDFVVKFDSGTQFKQSSDEIDLWEMIEPEDKKYFAPILQSQHYKDSPHGIGYVVQPYLKERKFYSSDERAEAYEEHWELIQELCVKYHLRDLWMIERNWMVTEEGPVIYDYGV